MSKNVATFDFGALDVATSLARSYDFTSAFEKLVPRNIRSQCELFEKIAPKDKGLEILQAGSRLRLNAHPARSVREGSTAQVGSAYRPTIRRALDEWLALPGAWRGPGAQGQEERPR